MHNYLSFMVIGKLNFFLFNIILIIFYSDAVVSQLKLTLSPLDFENFKKEINQLIKQDGINYIGMV